MRRLLPRRRQRAFARRRLKRLVVALVLEAVRGEFVFGGGGARERKCWCWVSVLVRARSWPPRLATWSPITHFTYASTFSLRGGVLSRLVTRSTLMVSLGWVLAEIELRRTAARELRRRSFRSSPSLRYAVGVAVAGLGVWCSWWCGQVQNQFDGVEWRRGRGPGGGRGEVCMGALPQCRHWTPIGVPLWLAHRTCVYAPRTTHHAPRTMHHVP